MYVNIYIFLSISLSLHIYIYICIPISVSSVCVCVWWASVADLNYSIVRTGAVFCHMRWKKR